MNDQTQATATTDDSTAPAASSTPPIDPVAALDELIAKAKAKRASISEASQGQAVDPSQPDQPVEPLELAGPTPEEIKEQQLAELAVKEQEAELENQRLLAEQQQKMGELAETPQYQARKTQDEEVAKQQSEQQAAQQGHVINQVTDAKV